MYVQAKNNDILSRVELALRLYQIIHIEVMSIMNSKC